MRLTTRTSRQRGAALVIGLILLAIITLLAVVGMNISNAELASATSEQLRLRAFQSAETGLERGLVAMFKVPAKIGAEEISPVTGIVGSPINPSTLLPMDNYKTTITYRGESNVAEGFGSGFSSFNYSVASEGTSARNSIARHVEGAYIVNNTGNQQSFGAL